MQLYGGGWSSALTSRTLRSTWPTFLRWGRRSRGPPLPLLPQLSAGVTVPALNTSSWPRYWWRVATGFTQSLSKTLASSELECKAACLCLRWVWNNGAGENRGNKDGGSCFSQTTSSLRFFTLFFRSFSRSLLILVWLSPLREELLFIWTSLLHKC